MNKVIQGDCLEVMRSFADNEFDAVITDPPYGLDIGKMGFTSGKQAGVAQRADYRGKADWDSQRPSAELIAEMIRVSKRQAIFGGQYLADLLPVSGGWLIWDKKTHEDYSNDFADCELVWTSESFPPRIIRYLWHGMMQKQMGVGKEKRYHPTQKPVEVMGKVIEKLTKEGETILDPFCGSGSTLVAADKMGRESVGVEISPEYVEISRQRISQPTLALTGNQSRP